MLLIRSHFSLPSCDSRSPQSVYVRAAAVEKFMSRHHPDPVDRGDDGTHFQQVLVPRPKRRGRNLPGKRAAGVIRPLRGWSALDARNRRQSPSQTCARCGFRGRDESRRAAALCWTCQRPSPPPSFSASRTR